MKPAIRVYSKLVVDNFAGGGGASSGIARAIGRDPDIAINHSAEALAFHRANHPSTRHLCGNVWDYDPRGVTAGRPVGLAWFSPDCTHFSRAKGGKPREKKIRALAWVAVRWAREVRPDIIFLENVPEFLDWGPIDQAGQPIASKRGLTFRVWLGKLRAAGYEVEWRVLRACDYGAPTSRKRLFLVARCDGKAIRWPAPTHGPGTLRPYRTAAEIIDWSIPCPSIFERTRPLAEATLRRIARGIERFVIGSAEPFIVPVTHPKDARVHSIPLRTITGANRGELALAAPTLIQMGYGEREGQAPRVLDLQEPLGTVVGGGNKHGLVAAFLAKHFGGHGTPGAAVVSPLSTVTAQDHHALVTSHMVKLMGSCRDGQVVTAPVPTVRAQGTHLGEVRAFLTRYNGTGLGQTAQLSLGTITSKPRFGLVTVAGESYEIADIGMRMLTPRELFRAQGFAEDQVIDLLVDGRPLSKEAQIRLCGNAVPPSVPEALVNANLSEAA